VAQGTDVVDSSGFSSGFNVPARRRALLVLAGSAAALVAVVYAVAVRTTWGQRLDATAVRGRREVLLRGIHAAGRLLTTIDIASLALLGGAIVLVALVRARPRLAVGAFTVIAGSILTTELLKKVLLSRPDLGIVDGVSREPTYPSGHTTVAMSLAVGAMLVAPSRWRTWVALLGAAFSAAIGTAVVATAAHRPSDPIGAALVVTAWAAAVIAVLLEPGDDDRHASVSTRASPWIAFGGLVLLVVAFVGAVATSVAIHRNRLDTVDLGGAFLAASAAIVGTILVCTAALLALLRGLDLDRPRV
jgi:membrane-associated phospholipid phosphatase